MALASPSHAFEKGDSNRCRNAYERILHAQIESDVLNLHKKNKVRGAPPARS